jgi:formate/nitrite transporter
MRESLLDSLLPAEIAEKAEDIGARKAGVDVPRTFTLAILAGAFIGLGAAFSTTVASGTASIPFGWNRLISGLAFSLGLIVVVLAGAELFTGNNLLVMAWANRKVSTRALLKHWAVVYAGNFSGASATAILVFAGKQYLFGGGAVGATALATAHAKCSLDLVQAFALGVLCNALVCLAVWISYGARTSADKILAVVPPITAFVAMGFEHSIANMYFVPIALLIKAYAPAAFWQEIGQAADSYPNLTLHQFLAGNLLPVTLGNVVGGALMVGIVYWFVYLRRKP